MNRILSQQTIPELCQLVVVDPMKDLHFRKASLSAEKAREFLEEYRRYVDLDDAHLAEMPGSVVPILVDVDLKLQNASSPTDLYAEEDVCAVAVAYARALKELFVLKETNRVALEFAVLIKDPRLENNACKHGFHLHSLNAAVKSAHGSLVYRRAKQHLKGQTTTARNVVAFPLDESLDDVSGKPWLLYGSTKRAGLEPFRLTAIVSVCMSTLKTTVKSSMVADVIEGVRLLSIRIPPSPTTESHLVLEVRSSTDSSYNSNSVGEPVDKNAMKFIWNKAQHSSGSICDDVSSDECAAAAVRLRMAAGRAFDLSDGGGATAFVDEGIDRMSLEDENTTAVEEPLDRDYAETVDAIRYVLTEMLKRSRSDSRSDWMVVCLALTNTCVVTKRLRAETAFELFREFSELSDKYDETVCRHTWLEAMDRERTRHARGVVGLSFRKIIFMAKNDYEEAVLAGLACEMRYTVSQLVKIICSGVTNQLGIPQSVQNQFTGSDYHAALTINGRSIDDMAKELGSIPYPRRNELLKVLKFLFGAVAPRRFANDDSLSYMIDGLACECCMGRFSLAEGLDLFIEVFGDRAPHLFTDRDSATLVWTAAINKASESIIKSTTRPHTIGITIGYALVDAPKYTQLMEKITTRLPRKVMDVYVAQALNSWWSHAMCFHDKKWYEFIGHYWRKRGDMESVIRRYLSLWYLEMNQQRLAASLGDTYLDDQEMQKSSTPDFAVLEALEKMTHNVSNLNRLVAALESFHAVIHPGSKAFSFNAKKNLIGMKNCVFDSDTLTLRPGEESDYIAHVLNFSFIEEANLNPETVEFIEDFLKKILPNNEKREYFLNSICHIYSGANPWKQYIICTGEGHNGKSVLFKLFEELLGPLVQKLNKGVILHNIKRDSLSPSPDMVKLATSRLAITDEIALGDTLNSGIIKLFSGNDTFTCRDLYAKSEDMVTVDPAFLPVIVCNRLPSLHRPDMAAWCRMRVFKFESRFAANVQQTLKEIKDGTLTGVNPNYVYPRNEKMASLLTQQHILDAFGSMLLHRYIKLSNAESRGIVMDSPPTSVLEAQTLFRVSQNAVKIAVAKKYEFRSPFEETVVDVDSLTEEERFRHEEFEEKKNQEYCDSISLREIIALVENSTGGRARFDVADIKEATKQFALAYKPFVTWDERMLAGLKLAA